MPIPVALPSNSCVCDLSLAGIAGMFLVSAVCCQVEVSVTG